MRTEEERMTSVRSESKSSARAIEAINDAAELLEIAHRAVRRAQNELRDPPVAVADRLAQQLEYLRGVTEVLRHEVERASHQDLWRALDGATDSLPATKSARPTLIPDVKG